MPNYGYPPIGRNLVNQRGVANNANSENLLPGKIKCHVCQKLKPLNEYAKRQLNKHKDSIYNPYAPGGRSSKDPKTTCRSCTPGQTVELTCSICHKTKGLDGFAKNQRKVPKNPRCIKCVELHLHTEPGLDIPSSDDYTDSDEDNEDFDNPTIVMHRSPVQRVAAPQPVGGIKKQPKGVITKTPMDDDDSDDDSDDGWESVQKAKPSYSSKASQSASVTDKDGRDSSRSSSTHQTQVSKSGWAKIKKVPHRGIDPQIEEGEHDDWSAYSRTLKDRRAGHVTTRNGGKKEKYDDDDFDDDDW